MSAVSLQTRIEQARAFHGDDFALIASKCGCSERRVREVVTEQDAALAEDPPFLIPTKRERRRHELVALLEREREVVEANARWYDLIHRRQAS